MRREPLRCWQRVLDTAKRATHDGQTVESSFSSKLAFISLSDCDVREIRLGSLWDKQPAVVVFLRHYG